MAQQCNCTTVTSITPPCHQHNNAAMRPLHHHHPNNATSTLHPSPSPSSTTAAPPAPPQTRHLDNATAHPLPLSHPADVPPAQTMQRQSPLLSRPLSLPAATPAVWALRRNCSPSPSPLPPPHQHSSTFATPMLLSCRPPPLPHLCHLKITIRITPQHTHCRSPALPPRGHCTPENEVARPPMPPPSIPIANAPAKPPCGHCNAATMKQRDHYGHPFSLPLLNHKHPDNAVTRCHRCRPPSLTTMPMMPMLTSKWHNGK